MVIVIIFVVEFYKLHSLGQIISFTNITIKPDFFENSIQKILIEKRSVFLSKPVYRSFFCHEMFKNITGIEVLDYVYTSKSGSDINWVYFERDPEVGRIADQNWIGSRVNARRIHTKNRLVSV